MDMSKIHLPNWLRVPLAAIGVVAMLIGFAGTPQTVKVWIEQIPWLSANVPWWAFLLFALFLMAVVWVSADAAQKTSILSEGHSQPKFFPNQRVMVEATGGLAAEFASLRNGWAAWETGDFFANRIADDSLPNLRRLILLDPRSPVVDRMARDEDHKAKIQKSIYAAQEKALGSGVAVRLNDGPLLNSIFHDPEGRSAWVRAQMFIPHQASNKWPNYRVEKASDPDQYNTLFRSYQSLWDESREISTPVKGDEIPQTARPVATETVDRFRELYASCRKAMEFARDLMLAEVTTTLTCFPDAQNYGPADHAVGELLERYVLADYESARNTCDDILKEDELDESEFNRAKDALGNCLRQYRQLISGLNVGGQIVAGDGYFSRPGYTELRKRHQAMLVELDRVRVRRGFQLEQMVIHHTGNLKNALRPPPPTGRSSQ